MTVLSLIHIYHAHAGKAVHQQGKGVLVGMAAACALCPGCGSGGNRLLLDVLHPAAVFAQIYHIAGAADEIMGGIVQGLHHVPSVPESYLQYDSVPVPKTGLFLCPARKHMFYF